MYQNKKILAVVPARGGSKGVPMKNIRPLHGIPLIGWTGKCLNEISEIDRKIVSSDHSEIKTVAETYDIAAPFTRPESLSGDRISDLEVLTHALETMEACDQTTYDIVLMLQPTSPMRKPSHVKKTFQKIIAEKYDAVWTVSPTDGKSHPLKQLTFTDNKLDYYDKKGSSIIARQQLAPVYHRNGVAYAITRDCLLNQKSIMGANCSAVIIDEPLANIDTELDFYLAEFLMNRSQVSE